MKGEVGICYELPGAHESLLKHAKTIYAGAYIGDYYVTNNRRSEFTYKAISTVEAFALSRSFIFEIFEDYP